MSESNLRGSLNSANLNRVGDALQASGAGDLLNALIIAMSATESGLVPSSNVVTLANVPSTLFDVNATAGTTTGHKQLLEGQITGPNAIVPATGQCVWDGGKKILFAAVDVVTAVSVKYAKAADATASLLQRAIGQEP